MQLTFVTGKGGAGKTRVTWMLAQSHPSSLLCESSSGLETLRIQLGLPKRKILAVTREELAHNFLKQSLPIETLAKWISHNRLFQTLLKLAPNLHEILLLYHWLQESKNNDLIIDAPSSGNFVALLEAVETAQKLFDGGSIRKMADEIALFLKEANETQVICVSLPEASSLQESSTVLAYLNQHFPNVKTQHWLNRKHSAPPSELGLPSELQALAYERPHRESKRIEGIKFDRIIEETSSCL